MATVAELKARLAKYAPKTAPEKESTNVEAAMAVEPVDSSAAERIVPVVDIGASADTVAVAVVTDLQPTTLVVLERPVADSTGIQADDNGENHTNLDTTNPVHQNFLQRLSDLEAALLARDPLMKTHLGEIHRHMIQYEEIANLLRPEEIAKIMAAQQQHTGIILRAETVNKSKASASKKASKLGVNDV